MTDASQLMPTPLVDVHWVKAHLENSEMVLLDCRFALNDPEQGRRAYESGHLPGAFYLDLNQDLSSPIQSHGGRHPLPNLETFVKKLVALGIRSNPATPVVAYDATKGAFAARLWWLLRYLGHEAVAVLDGGFPAWQAAGYALTQDMPELPHNGQFIPRIQADWVVNREAVIQLQADDKMVLVDARSPERYRGEQEPIDPVAGSIPGAVNFFWQNNLDQQGRFKSPPELAALWSALPSAENSIFYCGSGVTACVNLMAQALLEQPLPRLYVGGWSDWCSYE